MNRREAHQLMNDVNAQEISRKIYASADRFGISPIPLDYGVFAVLGFNEDEYTEYLLARGDHDRESVADVAKRTFDFHKNYGEKLLTANGIKQFD